MAPTGNRFGGGPHGLSNFSHLTQQVHHNTPRLQSQATAGLPPPSLGSHSGFANQPNFNPFAAPGGINAGLGSGYDPSQGLGGSGTGLGSREAKLGFAHGAALQQQQQQQGHASMPGDNRGLAKIRIREVWRHNMHQEMATLRRLVDDYPYVSMDTQFPGIVARPMGNFTDKSLYHYQTLRCNVDFLKVIQLGITLFNADGELPPPHPLDTTSLNAATYPNSLTPYPCTWQFNFQFSLNDDMFAQDSIEVLQKAGVDFDLLEKNGIDPLEFGAALIPSGLVLSDDVRWISYHSGYDFGYLLKIMLCKPLPSDETSYSQLINKFFPNLHDIKYIMKQFARNPNMMGSPPSNAALSAVQASSRSGVDELANSFGIKRVGPSNQAGPDCLITGKTFFEMRRIVFQGSIDDRLLGQVWGINGKDLPLWENQRQEQNASHASGSFQNGNAPSTPNATHAGLGGTPQNSGNGMGALTPGGGGGVFGGFQFSKA